MPKLAELPTRAQLPRCHAGALRCDHVTCSFRGRVCHEVVGYTCHLQRDHLGPHLWTKDDETVFTPPPQPWSRG